MKIKDLPEGLRQLAKSRVNKRFYYEKYKENNELIYAFHWADTPELHDFWDSIHKGDFSVYYEKYGKPQVPQLPYGWEFIGKEMYVWDSVYELRKKTFVLCKSLKGTYPYLCIREDGSGVQYSNVEEIDTEKEKIQTKISKLEKRLEKLKAKL